MGAICHTSDVELREGLPELAELLAMQPAIALSFVISLDGQLRGHDGSSRSLSDDTDLEFLRRLRASADVVVVGRRTAELEQYGPIRVREEFQVQRVAAGLDPEPTLVVVDRNGPTLDEIVRTYGPRVQLEAGIALHRLLAEHVERLWLSHAPVVVGDAAATFGGPLPPLRERWIAADYVVSRFEY